MIILVFDFNKGSDPSIKVTQYDISGCESFPCPFKRNTSITMKFNFTSTQPIDAVYNKLYGIIAGGIIIAEENIYLIHKESFY